MTTTDLMSSDLDAVFEAQDFDGEHTINGVSLVVIISDKKTARAKEYGDYSKHQVDIVSMAVRIRVKDMAEAPVPGSEMTVDGAYYEVMSTDTEIGCHVINLERRS